MARCQALFHPEYLSLVTYTASNKCPAWNRVWLLVLFRFLAISIDDVHVTNVISTLLEWVLQFQHLLITLIIWESKEQNVQWRSTTLFFLPPQINMGKRSVNNTSEEMHEYNLMLMIMIKVIWFLGALSLLSLDSNY